ncbi:peptidase U32 family protein [bacterium]
MELLAPAGTKESFIAAIRAGADAIYVGTKNFNARLGAGNFNTYDLEVLINHAHQKNVKVYITLNTLIKHSEINDAVATVEEIYKLKPDAVILQDLGLSRIIADYFPDMRMHASTQMAVHNSMGANVLKDMGFERVILGRELSLSEVKSISKQSKIEVEIFCHGALCFCISGMCLFSSLIGGYSGNRGLCTQPCRRIWEGVDVRGYLFSPRDLALAEYVRKLKKTKVASLKIEGRMRSSEYVYKTVKAYRMLIDAKDSQFEEVLQEARLLLDNDYARKKSICIFQGRDDKLFEIKNAQCLGKEVGHITKIYGEKIEINANEELSSGDRVRISNPQTDNTKVFKLTDISKAGKNYVIEQLLSGFSIGNPVFLAGSHAWNEKEIKKELNDIFNNYNEKQEKTKSSNAYTSLIARQWDEKIERGKNIWLKIDDLEWLKFVDEMKPEFIIFSVNKNNINLFLKCASKYEFNMKKVAVELTPFISQRDVVEFKHACWKFYEKGVNKFFLNNISHFKIVPDEAEKISGPWLYTMNAYSAKALKDYGVNKFTISWEHDVLNIARLCSSNLRQYLMLNIFGYPQITRSRMLKETDYKKVISDKKDIVLQEHNEADMNILIPEKPVMIFNAIEKMFKFGIRNFIIDLSYVKPSKNFLNRLVENYVDGKNDTESFKFNFKRGLK